MQGGWCVQNVLNEPVGVSHGDKLLPLRLRQGAGDLTGKMGRSEQFVNGSQIVIAQLQGFRAQRSGNHPATAYGSIQDIPHESSSRSNASKVSSSISPCMRRMFSM